MAKKAKQLQKTQGIMSSPSPRTGSFPTEVIQNVISFYHDDAISRALPGKKDVVSVKEGNKRVLKQKRLMLSNLQEAHQEYKKQFPNHEISISKFADLRPKECVLPGASGTHSVCVCTTHQNIVLMIMGSRLDKLTKGKDPELKGYKECLAEMTCKPPQIKCHLGACDKCYAGVEFAQKLEEIFFEVEEVEYKQWVTTDRTTLITVSEDKDEFINKFIEGLKKLRRHDFVAKKQSQSCAQKKERLEDGEVLVVCDFAENYSFVLQDAAQGFHWNNDQATVHPFVAYWKEGDELKHGSMVVISDCLKHDTVAVHLFQRQLVEFLECQLGRKPNKIVYFSDGAASQYKNYKNFVNLCNHEEEFGCKAEWHFFATSHGKGPCDGVGGTVKRLAARKSLQCPYNEQIMTPKDLFRFADSLPSVTAKFCSQSDYDQEEEYLKERFQTAATVKGTQKLHCFTPEANSSILRVMEYSDAIEYRRVKITGDENKQSEELDLDEIRGFVTAIWSGQWYLACVMSVDAEFGDVKLSFLKPPGSSGSYSFPEAADIGIVPASDILFKVDPNMSGRSGRTYKLSDKEKTDASICPGSAGPITRTWSQSQTIFGIHIATGAMYMSWENKVIWF